MADDGVSEWGVWGEAELVIPKQKDNATQVIGNDALGSPEGGDSLSLVNGNNDIKVTSSEQQTSRNDTTLAVEKIDDLFLDLVNQAPVEVVSGTVVYGTGVSGIDENIINNLDQSSLLDYQKDIKIDVVFEFNPEDEISTSFGVGEGEQVHDNRTNGIHGTFDANGIGILIE